MKRFLITLVAVLFIPACATVQSGLDKVLPKIEAAAGKGGVVLKVNGTELVNSTSLCLDPAGKVVGLLGKVPVVGQALLGVVGVCAAEPAPAEAPVVE